MKALDLIPVLDRQRLLFHLLGKLPHRLLDSPSLLDRRLSGERRTVHREAPHGLTARVKALGGHSLALECCLLRGAAVPLASRLPAIGACCAALA